MEAAGDSPVRTKMFLSLQLSRSIHGERRDGGIGMGKRQMAVIAGEMRRK